MGIKKRLVNGIFYYYLDRNLRLGDGHWKTFSVYIGRKKPSATLLKKYKKKLAILLNEYVLSNLVGSKTEFIGKRTALLLERIKFTFSKLLNGFDKANREKHMKRARQTFITNTNAIEGSRLTFDQTKKILELRSNYEIKDAEELEVLNMERCLELYDELLEKNAELDERVILRFHLLLLRSIPDYEKYAGTWRPVDVYIRGSNYQFPHWKSVPNLILDLLSWYKENKGKIHPVELAAKFHVRFVTIHPFADGNGRMARLLLNYILQSNGFPFVDIPFSKRSEYFETQEKGHFGKFKPFVLFLITEIKEQFKEFKRIAKKRKN
jgi:fido (protein-threonine AMPylation protein)